MKKHLLALALAGAMTLTLLSACGPAASDPDQPSATPAPTEESTPGGTTATAAEVYSAVYAAAGGNSTMDASEYMDSFYNLSGEELEDWALYMPDMSVNIEEIFIAKVKSGSMDAVKAACESRQQGMAEDAAFYPATGAYVADYKLVTEGDWLLFCVCENSDTAVETFRNSVK